MSQSRKRDVREMQGASSKAPAPVVGKKTKVRSAGEADAVKPAAAAAGSKQARKPKEVQLPPEIINQVVQQLAETGRIPKGVKAKVVTLHPGTAAAPAGGKQKEQQQEEAEKEQVEYTVEIVPPAVKRRGAKRRPEQNEENGESVEESDNDAEDLEPDEQDDPGDEDEDETELDAEARAELNIDKLMSDAIARASENNQKEGQKRAYKREFNIPCAYCEVMLKDYGYLFRHVTRLHKNEADVNEYLDEIRPRMRTACPICNKTVSSASNVSAHIKQCHAIGDRLVVCPLCEKSYKSAISLKQHLRQCHQPQVRKHKCPHCDMSFTENRSLREHINCTHETTQIFKCDECGKTFLTKGRLRRHKYIHSDFRHYCQYCKKGFHLKDNMNKHIEIMHEKKLGKRFQCPHCPKSFTVKGNMKQHIMGVHLRQYAYSCPICGEGYRRKKDMLLHMEQHKEGMSTLKIDDMRIDPHTIKLPPPAVRVQMAPTDGATTGTTVIEVLPQNIKVLTE